MDKFLIVTNQDKDKEFRVTKEIQRYLIEKGRECQLAESLGGANPTETGYTNINSIQENIDCVIVLGGDGTFIQTVRDFAGLDIPMVGVNMGTVGFLTTIEIEELHDGLDALVEGDYTIQNRMLLRGSVYRDGKRRQKSMAFNDVIVTRSGFSRLVELKIYVNDQLLDIYAADGVIISTPAGSTGYNLSAGGPVVFPETEMMIITPICPHSLSARSVVVSAQAKIKVEVGRRRKTQEEEALVTYDGDTVWDLKSGDVVEIARSSRMIPVVSVRQKSFCDILRNKMKNV